MCTYTHTHAHTALAQWTKLSTLTHFKRSQRDTPFCTLAGRKTVSSTHDSNSNSRSPLSPCPLLAAVPCGTVHSLPILLAIFHYLSCICYVLFSCPSAFNMHNIISLFPLTHSFALPLPFPVPVSVSVTLFSCRTATYSSACSPFLPFCIHFLVFFRPPLPCPVPAACHFEASPRATLANNKFRFLRILHASREALFCDSVDGTCSIIAIAFRARSKRRCTTIH